MGMLRKLFTTRSSVAGLPIGRRRTNWSRVAKTGAATVAAAGAARYARPGVRATKHAVGKGRTLVGKGKQAVDTATDIRDKATSAAEAASGKKTMVGKVGAAIGDLGSSSDGDDESNGTLKQRLIIREQIDVGVPKRVAYNQWTQFEDFPRIFKGVESVEQQDDETLKWSAKILPSRREWTAEITEQNPDERIAWKSKGGVDVRGVVTFHALDDNLTRVQVEMEYFPQGFVEKFGNLFLLARHRTRKDLRLFKHYIELQGQETGEWRGEISESDDAESASDDQDRGDEETVGSDGQAGSKGQEEASSGAKKEAAAGSGSDG